MKTIMEYKSPIQKVRVSGYKDYIALDFTDKEGKILSTPFYIRNGEKVEVHWGTKSSERVENPCVYDDWFDRYMFEMKEGKLYVRWINGISFGETITEVNPDELIDWKFHFAHKIIPIKNNHISD